MSNSEKKSLQRFMLIYMITTIVLIGLALTVFYKYEIYQNEESQRKELKREFDRLLTPVKNMEFDKINNFKNIKVAVYNGRKEFLFGTYHPSSISFTNDIAKIDNRLIYSQAIPPPHRNHMAFMVIEKKIDTAPIDNLKKIIILVTVFSFFIVTALSYFLGKLFIAPMKEATKKLNMFIQDATHELNTPISTILSNIEMLQLQGKCENNDEIQRIQIASKTLSRIYDDMTYIKLNNDKKSLASEIDISSILLDRIKYFSSLMDSKDISLATDIESDIIKKIDNVDMIRLYDNLISNAIKFTNRGGNIYLKLDKKGFEIEDTGRGMSSDDQKRVLERFYRADNSEGGFGIGLNIVSQICHKYGYTIDISSKLDKGTTIQIMFS